MVTVLEYTTEEQSSVIPFFWAEGLNAMDIHKDMFPVYVGKCLSRKAVHNWVADVSNGSAEVTETTVKRLLCCGFRRTGKAMGHGDQCWWRIYREMFFPGSNITCFTFYFHL
jgi:hypothetical protein